MKVKYIIRGLIMLATLCYLNSCKKYYDPPLVFEDEDVQNFAKDRKVMLISIDGLSGSQLYEHTPVHIAEMLANSKYSFEGLTDANTHDAATWTTMLTGKKTLDHGEIGNEFGEEADFDDDVSNHEGTGESIGYVSIYQRILESGRNMKSLSITPWYDLDYNLFNLSNENGVVESDEAVRDKAVDRIKNGDDNLSFVVLNFRSVNDAGLEAGFTVENAKYKSAMDAVDGYVGEVLEAVKQRENYEKEDWLIILTANHGGDGKSYGGATLKERKVPIIFYNLKFEKKEIAIPTLIYSNIITQKTNDNPTISAAKSKDYLIKGTGDYTVVFKVFHNSLASSHTMILGKTSHAYSSVKGWHFMYEGPSKAYRVIMNDGTGGNSPFMTYGPSSKPAQINVWQTVAARISHENGKRYIQVYVDGEGGDKKEMLKSPENENVGFVVGGLASSLGLFSGKINNLAFYNRALSNDELLEYVCLQNMDMESPIAEGLTGFWSMQDGDGKILVNSVVTGSDFEYTKVNYGWDLAPSWSCAEEGSEGESMLINQYDIASNIFYWLKISTQKSWGLAGTTFLDKYEKEFIDN